MQRQCVLLWATILWVAHLSAWAVTVTVDLANGPVNTIIPAQAIGSGVDGHSRGDSDAIYRPATVRAMLSTGLHPLSYRLRTELAIAAWHWNPRGHWSDSERAQGYWTSDDQPGAPILNSYGYRLPRRGNTIDQAEDDGYSRLADGDLKTFWKSNPYLDQRYTGEENRRHPQWLIADLGKRTLVNSIRIVWGTPYATDYQIQYWNGEDPIDPDEFPPGSWRNFADAATIAGKGGDVTLRLSSTPVSVRFVRVLMMAASGTAPQGATDPRDAMGYAVREVFIGTIDSLGRLRDAVRHGAHRNHQTRFFVSSTDPWHRALDRDPNIEQPGLDRVFASGLTHGLPVLVPVGVLYDTPENAAALLRYLRRRHYPTRGVELGEEPDGQYVSPEDYGALYLQAADALRTVDQQVISGGPSFQSLWNQPMIAWSQTTSAPEHPWLARFITYLQGRQRIDALNFLSFEWYPFDEVCESVTPQLQRATKLLTAAVADLYAQGLPRATPLFMTEYGFSAFSTQTTVDIAGALFNADALGTFLTLGGQAAYLYGYEPSPLYQGPGCNTWGNNTLFLSDDQRRIKARTATYHGARLIAQQWIGAAEQPHYVYPVQIDASEASGAALVNAYALQRPDGLWSLLLINQDDRRDWIVRIRFRGAAHGEAKFLRGPADLYQFSAAQYVWKFAGEHSQPLRSHPPSHMRLSTLEAMAIRLPARSLSVVRGHSPARPNVHSQSHSLTH